MNPVAATGFARAADVYERARPSYPREAVDWVAERTGIGPGRAVLDLGAGTGKLTRLLVSTGARVIAVEPVAEMRAKLDGLDGIEARDGTAEEIPLPDATADLVTVAQALHWFDLDRALPEFHRVLRPGRCLALFWNMRDLDDPLQRGVEELLVPLRRESSGQRYGAWHRPLEESPLFGPGEIRRFEHAQEFTADDLCDRVASTSFVATMAPGERGELLERVRALTEGIPEPFAFPYKTEVYLIPRSSDREENEGGTSFEG
jgi:SAM-dependent methyltransferase